jgi:hypothetical protein
MGLNAFGPSCKWSITCVLLLCAASAHAGNLEITFRNVVDPCEPGSPKGGLYVVRSTSGGAYIDDQVTDANGLVSWSGIAASTYLIEAYSSSGELWRHELVTVGTGTTTVELVRGEPRCYHFEVRAFGNNITTGTVILGVPLTFSIDVQNCADAFRNARVTMWLDRDHLEPYDFVQTSDAQGLHFNEGTRAYQFEYMPAAPGVYDIRYLVEAEIDGVWTLTHLGWWEMAINVEQPVGDLHIVVLENPDACDVSVPPGPVASDCRIVRSTLDGTQIDERLTDADGLAVWSDIDAGPYLFTVEKDGALWIDSAQVSVIAHGTTYLDFMRREPRAYDHGIYEGDVDITGGTIDLGTSVAVRVDVQFCDELDYRVVEPRIFIDRDRLPPYDHYGIVLSQGVGGVLFGPTHAFEHEYAPQLAGEYSYRIEIETLSATTDIVDWQTAFLVVGCAEDTNGDALVDADDLVNVILDWGTDGSAHGGDLDGNGVVNADDIVAVMLAWGPCT